MNNETACTDTSSKLTSVGPQLRKTSQYLMPVQITDTLSKESRYNIYPFHSVGDRKIFNGYDGLARWIIGQSTVLIDGYVGVYWHKVQNALQRCFDAVGIAPHVFPSRISVFA